MTLKGGVAAFASDLSRDVSPTSPSVLTKATTDSVKQAVNFTHHCLTAERSADQHTKTLECKDQNPIHYRF